MHGQEYTQLRKLKVLSDKQQQERTWKTKYNFLRKWKWSWL